MLDFIRCNGPIRSFKLFLIHIKIIKTAVFALLLVIFLTPAVTQADQLNIIRIGTGGLTGVYYPIGKIIAHGLTGIEPKAQSQQPGESGIPGVIGVAQNSAGSIENIRDIAAGGIEAGLVQADVASWAYHGQKMFKDSSQSNSIRVLASLYPEKFQIVTRKDAHIQSVHDLRKKRISLDEAGSGTLAAMQIILQAHGMSDDDLLPVYLKPVFTHEKLITGALQGFVMMAGTPMKAVTQVLDVGIRLVPVSEKMASAIQAEYPYLVPGRILADVYPGIPETPTIQVHALLVVNESMDDSLAFQITQSLWSQRTLSMLKKGHIQGKSITFQTALKGVSIPIHHGAELYYNEYGQSIDGIDQK